jgi:hypothetical protein
LAKLVAIRRTSSLVARLLAEWRCRLAVGLPHGKLGTRFQARELRDTPRLNAFCRVALVVCFKVRAMLAVRVFFFASVFKVRTSDAVHSRRFDFLAILKTSDSEMLMVVTGSYCDEKSGKSVVGRLWKTA